MTDFKHYLRTDGTLNGTYVEDETGAVIYRAIQLFRRAGEDADMANVVLRHNDGALYLGGRVVSIEVPVDADLPLEE